MSELWEQVPPSQCNRCGLWLCVTSSHETCFNTLRTNFSMLASLLGRWQAAMACGLKLHTLEGLRLDTMGRCHAVRVRHVGRMPKLYMQALHVKDMIQALSCVFHHSFVEVQLCVHMLYLEESDTIMVAAARDAATMRRLSGMRAEPCLNTNLVPKRCSSGMMRLKVDSMTSLGR